MQDSIRVHVVKYPDRENLVMRYRCPTTGKHVSRSTRTSKAKEAAKVAAKWEAELQEGRYQRTARMPWHEFKGLHEKTVEPTIRPSTAAGYSAMFNAFEKHCRPEKVGDLTSARVSRYAAELRKAGLKEATVAGHLRYLKAAARWAHRHGLLPTLPAFDMPKKVGKAKARAVTGEEFDRMLAAIPKAMEKRTKPETVESWKTLLRGLWWSGLRLGEALALRFDERPGGVTVRLDGQRSTLTFDPEGQKNGKRQTVPLAPEAVELIESLPYRDGYVFRPLRIDSPRPMARDAHKISKVISDIGEAAGIVVNEDTRKTASAHDLRRAFGFRWSRRVMPAALKTLMRHASIETTMTFYVGQDAEAAAAELWAALGTNQGTIADSTTAEKQPTNKKPLQKQGL